MWASWGLRWAVLVVLLILSSAASGYLIIYDSNGNDHRFPTFAYQRTLAMTGPVAADGVILIPSPNRKPASLSGFNCTNKIGIVASFKYAHFGEWIFDPTTLNCGLLALIVSDGDLGSVGGMAGELPHNYQNWSFPIHSGLDASWDTIQNITTYANITKAILLDDGAESAWVKAYKNGAFWFAAIALPFLQLGLLIFCIGRLIQFYHRFKLCYLAVGVLVIALEAIGALIRLVYWSVDPLGQRGVWGDVARTILLTASLPFSLNATVLLTFYWHRTLMGTQLTFHWSIDKLRIPTYSLVALVFIIEIVIDGLNIGKIWFSGLETINAAAYLVIALLYSVFYVVTAIRVLIKLRSIRQHHKSTQLLEDIVPIAVKIIVSSICWLAALCAATVTTSNDFYPRYEPSTVISVWVLLHLFLTLKSYPIVWTLRPPHHSHHEQHNHQHHHSHHRHSHSSPLRYPISDGTSSLMLSGSSMYASQPTPRAQSASLILSDREV